MSNSAMVAPPASIPSTEGRGAGKPPLSKSQKKRMKRNAAKAKREALEREQLEKGGGRAPTAASPSDWVGGEALNPHAKLRADLVAMGYAPADIESAQEEMWNMQMEYDDVNEVVSYLEARKLRQERAEVAEPPASVEEEVNTASTFASTAPSPSSEEASTAADRDGPQMGLEAAAATSAVVAETSSESTTPVSAATPRKAAKAKKARPPPADIWTKLDVVSNHENLVDAIFALTEWVTKAAKPEEIEDLCSGKKTRALPTVLRRSLLEPPEESDFESAVLPAVIELISGILRSIGSGTGKSFVPPASISSTVETFTAALRAARLAAAHDDSDDSAPSSGVADAVASRLSDVVTAVVSRTLVEIRDAGVDGGAAAVRRLESEIDKLASQVAAPSAGGVVELMTKRDCHKQAAEKSSTVVGIALVSKAGGEAGEGGANAGAEEGNKACRGMLGTDEEREKLLSSLFGGSYDAVMASKTEFETLQSQVDDALSSTSGARKVLVSEGDAYRSEREGIAARLEELRKEMEALEEKDAALGTKVEEVESKIADLDDSSSDEVKQLRLKLDEKEPTVRLEKDARSLVNKLGTFEASLIRASAAAASSQVPASASDNLGEKLPVKMGIYLVRMRNYFKAEADAVEFMRNRVSSLEHELKDLEREIQECTALGMTTNVNQMTQSRSTAQKNIDEDNIVIGFLSREAEQMRDALVKRLEEYENVSGEAFSALHITVLNGIAGAIGRIGLDTDGGLGAHLVSIPVAAPPAAVESKGVSNETESHDIMENGSSSQAEKDDAGHDVSPLSVASQKSSDENDRPLLDEPDPSPSKAQENIVPKFSWASAVSNGGSKKEVKSLLDIQREELSAKAQSNNN